MPVYNAPVRDIKFVIQELINFEQYREVLGYEDADPDTIEALLEEAGRQANEVYFPLNQSGDQEGCSLKDGVVTVPNGFKEAYDIYVESGWGGLACDPKYGGQGMPHALAFMVSEMFTAANHSFYMYPSLTHGAHSSLTVWGTEEQRQEYLPKLTSGEWTGTMNLTESHAGTDVGILRTKAIPQTDGTYRITGSKIFISAGEHGMADNIIHLVLAKLPDSPAGSKGISLFIVPKFLVNEDGSLGERNGVQCSAIEHKMGIKASATCVLDYEDAIGYMIGEPNKGLRAMFTMMNGARLGVAIEGIGAAELAYQNAAAYAKDRQQGRALTGKKEPNKPADSIIHHADVRRMLLTIRSFAEGARALACHAAVQQDISHKHPDADTREAADLQLQLLTPVMKALFTDEGTNCANTAIQVYGGHGYIWEHGVEQIARDARISQLYEGTNGVQSMDLVGRKLGLKGGAAVTGFFKEIVTTLKAYEADDNMQDYVQPMFAALTSLQTATQWLMENALGNPDNAGSAAVNYNRLFGVVSVGWMWVRMAAVCHSKLSEGTDEADFYHTKLTVGRFYMQSYLAEHSSLLTKVQAGCDTVMELPVAAF